MCHRVEGVADGDKPCRRRYRVATQAEGISGAVDSLVMEVNYRRDFAEMGDSGDDVQALFHVAAYHLDLMRMLIESLSES